MKPILISTAVLALVIQVQSAQAADLTYIDLVQRLADMEQLAVLPQPGEKTAQWSSYDRASKYDASSGKYLGWDANGDGDGIIRKEGDQQVMAEMEGPGCIWRIWSADAQAGRVRIYLDGAAEPAVDLQFSEYFNRKHAPFTRPALVHMTARGFNNYTPIPYQKSCKIVAEPQWGRYYQFVYQTFPKGTRVPTFKRELSAAESTALDRANEILQRGDLDFSPRPGQERLSRTVLVPPGKTVTVATLSGPRAITSLRARLDVPSGSPGRDILRELAIQMHWDGEKDASVWAPFGDFFGVAGGANTYRSLPLGHTGSDWWYSAWYMPFAKEGSIQLVNDGKEPREVLFEITHAPLSRPVSELGRFHAKWHRDAFPPAEPERARIDWTMLTTKGAGRFAGVMLHIWNPRGAWWGEGDEKFHVDGEKFPSTIGTGSEDYFGYAWCDPGLFENAYHNQPLNDGNNRGHVCVNRWHIADNIPFHTSFEAFIEKYFPNKRPTLYASTVYWYLSAEGEDPYRPASLEERIGYFIPAESLKVPGAMEGERLKIISSTGGNPHEQDLSGFGDQWSNDAQLWWVSAQPGDKLELALPVNKAGRYKLGLQLTKARDYGIVQLWLDGEKLGGSLDLYNPDVVPAKLDFGTRDFSAGQHTLRVEILGANPQAARSYMFGLDYVKLEPVP